MFGRARRPGACCSATVNASRSQEASTYRTAAHAVPGMIAFRMLVGTRTREKLCTSCTPDVGGRNKVCKTGAGNSLDDTGNVRLRSGNSQGEPGNTPDDPGNTSSAPSHTPRA